MAGVLGKRPREEEAAGLPHTVTLRVVCPPGRAGWVIGKGGEAIRGIRSKTGAQVKVEDPIVAGRQERIVVVSSPDKPGEASCGAQDALQLVLARMLEAENPGGGAPTPPETAEVHLIVDRCYVGSIVGRGGAVIKQICADSGANIHNLKDPSPLVVADEQIMQISGPYQSVRQGVRLVSDKIREGVARGVLPPARTGAAPGLAAGQPQQMPGAGGMRMPGMMGPTPGMATPGMPGAAGMAAAAPGAFQMETVFRCLVPDSRVGPLIGKGGENLRVVQQQCGASVQVEHKPHQQQHSEHGFRLVTCKSSELASSAVCGATEALLRCVLFVLSDKGEDLSSSVLKTIHIVTAGRQLGAVIGVKGATMRQITSETSARLFVEKDKPPGAGLLPTDEVLKVEGTMAQLLCAVRIVALLLRGIQTKSYAEGHGLPAPPTPATTTVDSLMLAAQATIPSAAPTGMQATGMQAPGMQAAGGMAGMAPGMGAMPAMGAAPGMMGMPAMGMGAGMPPLQQAGLPGGMMGGMMAQGGMMGQGSMPQMQMQMGPMMGGMGAPGGMVSGQMGMGIGMPGMVPGPKPPPGNASNGEQLHAVPPPPRHLMNKPHEPPPRYNPKPPQPPPNPPPAAPAAPAPPPQQQSLYQRFAPSSGEAGDGSFQQGVIHTAAHPAAAPPSGAPTSQQAPQSAYTPQGQAGGVLGAYGAGASQSLMPGQLHSTAAANLTGQQQAGTGWGAGPTAYGAASSMGSAGSAGMGLGMSGLDSQQQQQQSGYGMPAAGSFSAQQPQVQQQSMGQPWSQQAPAYGGQQQYTGQQQYGAAAGAGATAGPTGGQQPQQQQQFSGYGASGGNTGDAAGGGVYGANAAAQYTQSGIGSGAGASMPSLTGYAAASGQQQPAAVGGQQAGFNNPQAMYGGAQQQQAAGDGYGAYQAASTQQQMGGMAGAAGAGAGWHGGGMVGSYTAAPSNQQQMQPGLGGYQAPAGTGSGYGAAGYGSGGTGVGQQTLMQQQQGSYQGMGVFGMDGSAGGMLQPQGAGQMMMMGGAMGANSMGMMMPQGR